MNRHACYSVTECVNHWFWVVWHDLGSCWFDDTTPFAYGRAKSRELAIAQAQEVLGVAGQMTDARFAAQWKQRLQQLKADSKLDSKVDSKVDPQINSKVDAAERSQSAQRTQPRSARYAKAQSNWTPASAGRASETSVPVSYLSQLRTLALTWPFTQQQLVSAYRQKLRETHPDLGGTPEALIAVCEAYKLLKAALDESALRSFGI